MSTFYILALLLPCSVCLLWALQLFCKKRNHSRPQNRLMICALSTGCFSFIVANFLAGITNYVAYYQLEALKVFVALLIFPQTYLYIKSVSTNTPFNWKDYLCFLPAIIIGGGTFILNLAMGQNNAIGYAQSLSIYQSLTPEYAGMLYRLHYLLSIQFYSLIIGLECFGVSIYAVYTLLSLRHHSNEPNSLSENKTIKHKCTLLIWLILASIFTMLFIFTRQTFWNQHTLLTELFFISWSGVYFGWFYQGSRTKYIAENWMQEQEKSGSTQIEAAHKEPESDNQLSKYPEMMQSFSKFIDEDKIFLRNNLRIDELAHLMQTNRSYISRML